MRAEMDSRHGVPRRLTGHLVAELTSFVGRQREVAQVKRLLSGNRLVTLTGAGGTGKTRVAVRVAGELRRVFADGVRQVDLAELTDGSLVGYAVAQALSVLSAAQVPTPQLLAEHLADRELLLVLDNCEHVLDACAALVDELLRSAPGLSVLCTSQQPLGILGETVWTLPPLPVPPASEPDNTDPVRYPAPGAARVRPGATVPAAVQPARHPAAARPAARHLRLELRVVLAGRTGAVDAAVGLLRVRSGRRGGGLLRCRSAAGAGARHARRARRQVGGGAGGERDATVPAAGNRAGVRPGPPRSRR